MAAPTFTPVQMPTLPTPPPAPSTPVVNPETAGRESFLRNTLDPTNAAYIGNKYRPMLQGAGRDLQAGLEGFGHYTFAEDAQGGLTPQKQEGGQPGQLYRQSYFDARSQAAAAGMLYSRTAEQAVGDAWHRLSDQERGVLNQYADQETQILGQMAGEFTGAYSELIGLYGSDVKYALDHPLFPSDPVAAMQSGAGAAAGAAAAGNPTAGNPWAWGKPGNTQRNPGGPGNPYAWGQPGNTQSHAPVGHPDAPAADRWIGKAAPNLGALSKAWGVPISELRVTRSGTGQNVVTVKSITEEG